MYQNRNSGFAVKIHQTGDSDEVKKVKRLLTTMLALDPNARPTIEEVVERLDDMRDAIGLRSLFAVDVVWSPTKLCGMMLILFHYI